MAIRVRAPFGQIDNRKIAAALAPSLIGPKVIDDESSVGQALKPGSAWVRWSDTHAAAQNSETTPSWD